MFELIKDRIGSPNDMQNRKYAKAKIVTKLGQLFRLSTWAMNLWDVLAFLIDLD